jgi:hypothetical protein
MTNKFNYIVQKANELFNELSPGTETLYIMLDELELSLANTQLYERDSEIIRDLIVSIEKMNTISKKKRFNLKIIGAIRSEVLTVVASLGKEINKTIADFGIPINWSQSGGNVNTHPLLQIILKRIVSSETYYNLRDITDDQNIDFEQIWETYFYKKIQDMSSANYILNLTWNIPRDIIRLLTLVSWQFSC